MIAEISTREWERQLAEKAYADRRHIPASWETEYDDGADGCVPDGWYLTGLNKFGMSIDFPIRLEFGPFKTEEQAEAHALHVMPKLEAMTDPPPERSHSPSPANRKARHSGGLSFDLSPPEAKHAVDFNPQPSPAEAPSHPQQTPNATPK